MFNDILNGFKQFVVRGNVIDLAIGVMVGGAFNNVVNALVKDLMTPFVAALFQQPDFSGMVFIVHGSKFTYGDFVNSFISFIITAITIYFAIVLPINHYEDRRRRGRPPLPALTKNCPECTKEIPVNAKRCPECTAVLKQTV